MFCRVKFDILFVECGDVLRLRRISMCRVDIREVRKFYEKQGFIFTDKRKMFCNVFEVMYEKKL